jgi:hypothetical protein
LGTSKSMRTSSAIRHRRQPWLTRLLFGELAIGNGIGGTSITDRGFRTRGLLLLVLGTLPAAYGQAGFGSTTQGLTAAINPAAQLTVGGSLTLLPGGAKFSPFQGTVPISYRARTTPGGAAAGRTITARVTTDFAGGGPSAASGALQYTCTGATLGTACAAQTASTASETLVLTLPQSACTGGTCAGTDPNTINLNFTLIDDPGYQTGSYSAVVRFTISAI